MEATHGPWGTGAAPTAATSPNAVDMELQRMPPQEQVKRYGYLINSKPQTIWQFLGDNARVAIFFSLVSVGWSLSIVGNVGSCGILNEFLTWINVLITVAAIVNLFATYVEGTRHSVEGETVLKIARWASLFLYLLVIIAFIMGVGAFTAGDCNGPSATLFKIYIGYGLLFSIVLLIVGAFELHGGAEPLDVQKDRKYNPYHGAQQAAPSEDPTYGGGVNLVDAYETGKRPGGKLPPAMGSFRAGAQLAR